MARKGPKLRPLATELARRFPSVGDPHATIGAGDVLVDGIANRNPASLVAPSSAIALRRPAPLRGEAKLRHALATFRVAVEGRISLDVGAAAGGFTRVLLDAGAARVYAVDAGYGQLLGSLRQDPRVVVLERTNLGDLTPRLVPDELGVVSMDLSYLPIARAAAQLGPLGISPGADLVALVKPQHELALGSPPTDRQVRAAVQHATRGLAASRWTVIGATRSPMTGSRGAVEWLVRARRDPVAITPRRDRACRRSRSRR
jgi:23S rRNA (cytidine1920-2'-O)/16S rRNA (cytidine1409-2'-O)-methyltransferase